MQPVAAAAAARVVPVVGPLTPSAVLPVQAVTVAPVAWAARQPIPVVALPERAVTAVLPVMAATVVLAR